MVTGDWYSYCKTSRSYKVRTDYGVIRKKSRQLFCVPRVVRLNQAAEIVQESQEVYHHPLYVQAYGTLHPNPFQITICGASTDAQ